MLLTISETQELIKQGKALSLAGDEQLLKQLPKGCWIAGTIPYFMSEDGGVSTKDKIFVSEISEIAKCTQISWYDESKLANIPNDAPENGFSIIIIPATSDVHIAFSKNASDYENMFMKPLIGWISGVHLDDLGSETPKVMNGELQELSSQKAVVMHFEIPSNYMASISILNLFEQGSGDSITFETDGFQVNECLINGVKTNFADYLIKNDVNIEYPLVADYSGTMVNASFQAIQEEGKLVDLYAPVFKGITYKLAKPVDNYVEQFKVEMPKNVHPVFSCNCILNYLYSHLEGKKTGAITGPITFGEIAYQLLNQTLVYLELNEV